MGGIIPYLYAGERRGSDSEPNSSFSREKTQHARKGETETLGALGAFCGYVAKVADKPLNRTAAYAKIHTPFEIMKIKRQVMNSEGIELAISRIAAEVLEGHQGDLDNLAIIGIRRRGVYLGQRLAQRIEAILKRPVPTGILDITMYRDDLTTIATWPLLRETLIEFSIEGKSLVLVDDVLYTGRTIRAALDGLIDMGRPRRVQLAVLIDRGHRELPIQADYVGKFVETTDDEIVEVRLMDVDNEERVVVVEQQKTPKAE